MKSNAERMSLGFRTCEKDKILQGDKKAEFLQSGQPPCFPFFCCAAPRYFRHRTKVRRLPVIAVQFC